MMPSAAFDGFSCKVLNDLLLITPDVTSGDEFRFNIYQYRMFLNDDSDEIYVGGDQVLLKVDVNDYRVIQVGVFVCLFFALCNTLISVRFVWEVLINV